MNPQFVFSFILIFVLISIIGTPLLLLIDKLINKKSNYICLFVLTPNFGIAAIIWFSTIFAKLGIAPQYCLLFLFSIGIGSIFISKQSNVIKNVLKNKKILLVAITLIFVSFTINSLDIFKSGWSQYFPVTNGDTFAYLGHIDQISRNYSEFKSLVYPSGLMPMYQHAISYRTGVVSLVAVLNILLKVDTHQIFFLVIRMIFPLSILNVFFILLNIEMKSKEIFFSLIIIVLSNFGLHSVFQQFLSASIGIVIFWLFFSSLFLLNNDLGNKYSWLLLGVITGILGLSSIEAYFVLLPMIIIILLVLIFKNKIKSKINLLLLFSIGSIIGLFPIIKDSLGILISQLSNGLGDHPGNWIARADFIIQFLGLKIYLGEVLSLKLKILIISIFFLYLLSFYLSFSIYLKSKYKYRTFILILFLINFYYLVVEVFLFILKKGYSLLKISDYFSFLIIFTILFSLLFYNKYSNSRFKRILHVFFTFLLIVYALVSLREKIRTENRYLNYVKNSLSLDLIKKDIKFFTQNNTNKNYAFDSSLDVSDLFLYIGRDFPIRLISLHNSNRYKFNNDVFPDYVISANGIEYADINQKNMRVLEAGNVLILKEANKYISIDNESGNWLGAECGGSDYCFQWLSSEGKLKIYLKKLGEYKLHFKIACGPDWDNNQLLFEIDKNKQKLYIDCAEKNEVTINIIAKSKVTNASIIINGVKKGIRQISISNLYIE